VKRIFPLLCLLALAGWTASPPVPAAGQQSQKEGPEYDAGSAQILRLGQQLSPEELGKRQTQVQDSRTRNLFLGRHGLTLQWIGWEAWGSATVKDVGGLWRLTGSQYSQDRQDYLIVDGAILSASPTEFVFAGTILTRVSCVNNGRPCKRVGTMKFAATGKRRYWRLQEIGNCDTSADYVDLYFK
jgi:hypothetical protein